MGSWLAARVRAHGASGRGSLTLASKWARRGLDSAVDTGIGLR